MAAVSDCFSIGSTVLCTTCFKEDVEGEVLAYDHQTKMLILKCGSKSSKNLNDIYVLNLELCSNVQVVKECSANFVEDPQKLSLEQLKLRLRRTLRHRQTYLKSKNANVSPEAQELYRAIAKQFEYKVTWQGSNIQIFNEVTISPPYRVENISSTSENDGLCDYIKRMIENFNITRASRELNSNVSSTSGTTTSSPAESMSTNNTNNANTNNMTSASPVPANS